MLAWLGRDTCGIDGSPGESLPESVKILGLPVGYIFCPGCGLVTRLPGIAGSKWFGRCLKCSTRIVYRAEDSAIAYVTSGWLHSHGFEQRSFKTYIGDHVLYPYVADERGK